MEIEATVWEIWPIPQPSISPHTIRSHPLAFVLHPCAKTPCARRVCVPISPALKLKAPQRIEMNEHMVNQLGSTVLAPAFSKRSNHTAITSAVRC